MKNIIVLCRDCENYNSNSFGCRRKIVEDGIDLVTGTIIYMNLKEKDARKERMSIFGCGKKGKYWNTRK